MWVSHRMSIENRELNIDQISTRFYFANHCYRILVRVDRLALSPASAIQILTV
jgi:hypothetical protein